MILPLLPVIVQEAPRPTLSPADLEPLVGTKRGMVLADRLLPPGIRDRVVEGQVRRPWGPSLRYWIGFKERARVAGPDLCERGGHAVEAWALPGKVPPDTKLTIDPLRSWTELAALPPGTRATAAACEGANYVGDGGDAPRTVAAYRVLVAAMAAARGGGSLPFRLSCRAEKPAACTDARAALAGLPMDALFRISTSCLEAEQIRERYQNSSVYMVRCPPLSPGQPYQVEVSFGKSGPDGQSWRVSFTYRADWPEEVALRRSTVIYH